ncbi:hypothetical protein C8R45DRAFT_994706 [Mycena sanguinolenta]|nr:hypothetical protein C8R45DRAFT_994706 [Mycena sanguinolenta]
MSVLPSVSHRVSRRHAPNSLLILWYEAQAHSSPAVPSSLDEINMECQAATLAVRAVRRHKKRLGDETSALRLQAVHLRNTLAAIGLSPVQQIHHAPSRMILNDEEEMEEHFGPVPVLPATPGSTEWSVYMSTLASRKCRLRKLKALQILEEEVMALRAEVGELQRQIRRVDAKL